MSVIKQVIAMGDGGTNGKDPFMDLYIIAQSKAKLPKVCFFGTAGGDNEGYSKYFKQLFGRYPCKPTSLSLFNPHTKDIRDFIMSQDIIYVGGGHTKSMLGVWREWGVDKFLAEAYNNGTILSGGSAGSVCWFDQCVTDSIPGSLTVMNCLGILPYSNCPHYASMSRRASYSAFVKSGAIKPGYAADDYAGLHFVDGQLVRGISSKHYAKTYKVFLDEAGELKQKRLKTYWLGLNEYQEKFIFNSPAFSREESIDEEGPTPEQNESTSIVTVANP